MTGLRIARGFALPVDVAGEAIAILAKRGAGKTNTGRVLVEELHAAHVQIVVLDPVGAWWGLRSSADGKREGLPLPILGGAHGDVPLQPTAGALLADVVIDTGQSIVLDLSDFSKSDQRRFVTDFAERLYTRKARARGLLHLVLEEADEFVPQRVNAGDARMVGAIEALVRRGRGRGIGLTMITQRSASLNKAVLTQADVLIVMRTTGPQDRKAIEAWVEKQDVDGADDVVRSLSQLETGEAWIWNPERGLLERVKIRLAHTFDSSSTPKAGERRSEPQRTAAIDLTKLGAEIEATAERAKLSDPSELRKKLTAVERERDHLYLEKTNLETKTERLEQELAEVSSAGDSARVAELEAELARVTAIAEELDVERADAIAWWEDEHLKFAGRLIDRLHAFYEEALTELHELRARSEAAAAERENKLGEGAAHARVAASEPRAAKPAAAVSPAEGDRTLGARSKADVVRPGRLSREVGTQKVSVAPARGGDLITLDELGKGERSVLGVLAEYPEGRTRNELAFLAGYSAKASTIGVILGSLRKAGLVEPGNPIRATAEGLAAAGGVRERPTGQALLAEWLQHQRMGEGERRVLLTLIDAYPHALGHEDLCERTGYSPAASTMGVIVSKLRKLGLVEKGARKVAAEFYEAIT